MQTNSKHRFSFLAGGGACGDLIASRDWTNTSLGAIDTWPVALTVTIANMLHSKQPMLLFWGPELIQFYNDSFIPSFGLGKHPVALGQHARDSWADAWPVVGAQIEAVMTRGEPAWFEDALVPIFRNGRMEEVFWTYSYSPSFDDFGLVNGTLVIVTETTGRVLFARRLEALARLASMLASADTYDAVFSAFLAVVEQWPSDLPFATVRASDISSSPQLTEAQREELSYRTAAGGALPIDQLTRRLRLRRVDEEMLLAATAFEIDPLFVLSACALNGEDLRQGLTARVLALLFDLNHDEGLVLQLGANHPLVVAGLLEAPPANQPITAALCPYLAPARTVAFLDGSNELDSALTHIATLIAPPGDLVTEHWTGPLTMIERTLQTTDPVLILIEGAEGAGRRTAVSVAAQRLGRETLSLDASRLARDRSRLVGELRAFRRECWLRSAVPVFSRFDLLVGDGAGNERLAEVVEAIESSGATLGPIVIASREGTQLPEFRHRLVRVRIEAPPVHVRRQLWASALGGDLRDDVVTPLATLAQRHTLPPGVIRSAAGNARLLAGDRAITVADVQTGLATEIRERFSGLATRADLGERWDDLVLPQDTLDEVIAFVSRAQNAALVYDRWGFRDKLQRGLGLSALFSGPPGTGKTMVAGLVARTLGLDLYIVDLSQVVSKWVGETEKQLGKIFDAAQMGQALLLFDEADALFAKRTEVKSSNDRYANLEVNYLLQRIEQFSGVAILTTNLETSVDPAFKRRLAADVHFYAPEQTERERLWRTLLPREVPVAADLDFAQLATLYPEMCGGHIRNVVLRSAFLAAAEPASNTQAITQELLIRAARTEYRAMGKIAV